MTKVIPFRGILFNRDKVSCDDVIAPPYDLITPAMRDSLYGRSPHNIVRVDFGKELPEDTGEQNKYTRAAGFLEDWQEEGVLRRSERPSYYAYRMDFSLKGRKQSVTGFFGLVRLVELGKGVYPHEATHSKPKSDRLSLMHATGANTSPIFSLYRSEDGRVDEILKAATARDPYLSGSDPDGTVHSLWVIDDPGMVQAMGGALSEVPVFIADGHHRYETALDYQSQMRSQRPETGGEQPFDYVLMFLADVNDEGLQVLPTHRLVTVDVERMLERLPERFEVYELPSNADIIDSIEGKEHAFGLYAGGRSYALTYKGGTMADLHPALQELDVVILHKLVFGRLLEVGNWGYEMDAGTVRNMVDNGEYDAAFFLNPTPVEKVKEVALEGLRMPPKSTYFYPKVQTGFVINSLKSF